MCSCATYLCCRFYKCIGFHLQRIRLELASSYGDRDWYRNIDRQNGYNTQCHWCLGAVWIPPHNTQAIFIGPRISLLLVWTLPYKRVFQQDAYCPLASCTCFRSHQMAALVEGILRWTSLSRSPFLPTRCLCTARSQVQRGGGAVQWGPMSRVALYGVVQ